VGDVHGRLDLLDRLLRSIEDDLVRRPTRKAFLIFLGDLIDRGPDSRGVVERLRTFRHEKLKTYFLAGNHEEVLLRLLAGERGILDSWLKYGGAQCLRSYGCDPATLDGQSERMSLGMIKDAIPSEHARFIGSFADTLTLGDYLFVHAGIRPGVDLSLQSQADLRWIRSPFLDHEEDHGFVVVHGHTISDGIEERANRIGIDTGAYRTGVLTALVLDGAERSTIDTAVTEPERAAQIH
jgi:serine/threonine protein phosphatase 1